MNDESIDEKLNELEKAEGEETEPVDSETGKPVLEENINQQTLIKILTQFQKEIEIVIGKLRGTVKSQVSKSDFNAPAIEKVSEAPGWDNNGLTDGQIFTKEEMASIDVNNMEDFAKRWRKATKQAQGY